MGVKLTQKSRSICNTKTSDTFTTSRRANAQQPKLFVGMILILIFAEALALYGLIGALLDCHVLQACMCEMPVAIHDTLTWQLTQCNASCPRSWHHPGIKGGPNQVTLHPAAASGCMARLQAVCLQAVKRHCFRPWCRDTRAAGAIVPAAQVNYSACCLMTNIGEQLVSHDISYKDWPTASR